MSEINQFNFLLGKHKNKLWAGDEYNPDINLPFANQSGFYQADFSKSPDAFCRQSEQLLDVTVHTGPAGTEHITIRKKESTRIIYLYLLSGLTLWGLKRFVCVSWGLSYFHPWPLSTF